MVSKFGITSSYIDATDLSQVEAAIKDNTKVRQNFLCMEILAPLDGSYLGNFTLNFIHESTFYHAVALYMVHFTRTLLCDCLNLLRLSESPDKDHSTNAHNTKLHI